MTLFNLPIKHKKQNGTGRALELAVIPSLQQGGYALAEQVIIGRRITGLKHKVDIVARKPGAAFLISVKWQQEPGTAEQKVPFEVICLKDAVIHSLGEYRRAYLVLGGVAWTIRDFYISDEFEEYLPHRHEVTILTLEDFMARANKGVL